jgi:hypothetical protein
VVESTYLALPLFRQVLKDPWVLFLPFRQTLPFHQIFPFLHGDLSILFFLFCPTSREDQSFLGFHGDLAFLMFLVHQLPRLVLAILSDQLDPLLLADPGLQEDHGGQEDQEDLALPSLLLALHCLAFQVVRLIPVFLRVLAVQLLLEFQGHQMAQGLLLYHRLQVFRVLP